MKQNVSLLLALMLVVCVIVLPVCAEEVEEPTQTTEAVAICKGFQNRNATEDLCRRCGFARRFQ